MPRGRKPKNPAVTEKAVEEVKVMEVMPEETVQEPAAEPEVAAEPVQEPPKKRGRKPGVKNKPKEVNEEKVERIEKSEKPEVKETKAAKSAKAAKPAKATENKIDIYVEFSGNQYKTEDIISSIQSNWMEEGHRLGSIKSLNVYIKPEAGKAYYVINDKNAGDVSL